MKNNRGFTLAEMLIVVAITVILLGVSFVGVQNYQASMTRLELDAIAKEIFIAAQNHLTTAEGQGYLNQDMTDAYSDNDTEGIYYVLNDGEHNAVLNLLLPDYAIDLTVRTGSFVVRYQPSTATVLDVFYSRPQSGFLTRPGAVFKRDEYNTLLTGYRGDSASERSKREDYDGKVIGWYGGGEPGIRGERLRVPTFRIINAERLLVEVTDPNAGLDFASLKLIVTGDKSGAEKVFSLRVDGGPNVTNEDNQNRAGAENGLYTVVLDAITGEVGDNDLRFEALKADTGTFIPGEDLKVKVVAYSNTKLTNIAMSEEKTTNSLFADPAPAPSSPSDLITGSNVKNGAVGIANLRHFENLDGKVSGYKPSLIGLNTDSGVTATQLSDLSWPDFKGKTGGDGTRIIYGDDSRTDAGCFYPVSPDYALEYDGQGRKITEVKVKHGGDAGLFGALPAGSAVHDLELIDFDIATTGENAGALAGSATSTAITNVLARSTAAHDSGRTTPDVAASGSAGGLVGSLSGGSVTKSAAALIVGGGTSAGGLIGTASNSVSVTRCYSGGHTNNGTYYDAGGDPIYNVTASDTAGGLIGSFTGARIENSYSTCSVKGDRAGGLAGEATVTEKITNCYCTGLVSGTTEGAFAGSLTGTAENCKYFEIINERADAAGFTYLGAGTGTDDQDITPFDADASSYNAFVGGDNTWDPASAYDTQLETYYKNTFPLRTVSQLSENTKKLTPASAGGQTDGQTVFVRTHYGDWPAPEIFVINN